MSKYNPDLNQQDIYKNTPLIYAVKTNNKFAVLQLLKNKEIDIDITNNDDDNALTLAIKNDNLNFVLLLRKNEANLPLNYIINNELSNKYKFLLNK